MTHGTLDIPRLTELCGAMCDGVIDADGASELDAMLARDPMARRIYGVVVDTHLDLEANAAEIVAEPAHAVVIEPTRAHSPWRSYARAAVVVLAAAIVGIVVYVMSGEVVDEPIVPQRPVAVLVDAVGVSWASEPMNPGDEVVPGTLRIDRGRIDLTMHSGVTVTAVGPAELTLRSRGRCVLTRGQVTANVPQRAIGFTLATPRFTVVDLGTEFGVRVRSDGSGEVRVFDGSVSVDDGRKRIVTAGHGRRYTAGGSGEDFAVTARWREDAPRIVRYSFDEGKVDPILDSGFGFKGGPFDIETIKRRELPRRVGGVFGTALDLRPGDVFDTGFAGVGGGAARTVAFWLKVPTDAKQDESQAIVSWGDGKVSGGAWQIGWDRWSTKARGALRVFVGDHGVIAGTTDLRDGQWHHVAVVLEAADEPNVERDVRMYIDGKAEAAGRTTATPLETATSGDASPVRIGWDLQGDRASFRGTIDELIIVDRALTVEKIAALTETNDIEQTLGD